MTTALDTNVLVALINSRDPLNRVVADIFEDLPSDARLVICGPVYAELLAFRGRTEAFLNKFIRDTSVEVEWQLGETVWRAAGLAFGKYAERRRKSKAAHPRRILADFFIGAHADTNRYSLLTLDDRLFRAAFPKLRLISF